MSLRIDEESEPSISELHMTLLSKICQENEKLTKKVSGQERVLSEITTKLDQLVNSSQSDASVKRGRRKASANVPRKCSVSKLFLVNILVFV